MKTAFLLIVFGTLAVLAQTPVAFRQFSVTNATTAATAIVSSNLPVCDVTLVGLKYNGSSNAAPVFFGPLSNSVYYTILPGEVHVLTVDVRERVNLKDWYLRAPTANDGLLIISR